MEEWKSRLIDGSAMFATVLSSMTMNSAKHIAPNVHHLRFSSVIAGISPLLSLQLLRNTAKGIVQ